MSNYCDFEIHVRGRKKDCKKFYEMMWNPHLKERFYGIGEALLHDQYGTEDDYCMEIVGCCSWSVKSSMCTEYATKGREKIASIGNLSARLRLDVESWAEERGFEFQEHLRYQNGKCLVNECHDVTWHCYDRSEYSSFEEFLKENELTGYTEDDLDDNDEIIVGAQEWTFANDRSSMNLMKAA